MQLLHTNFYSDEAFNFLEKFFSFGKTFTNTSRRGKVYYDFHDNEVIREPSNEVCIKCNDDRTWYRRGTKLKAVSSQEEGKQWLAMLLKYAVQNMVQYKAELKDSCYSFIPSSGAYYNDLKHVGTDYDWDRSSEALLDSFNEYEGYTAYNYGTCSYEVKGKKFDKTNTTIADVYMMYDMLLSRKKIDNKWSKKQLKKLQGEENDPIKTEMEITRREEIKKLEEKLKLDKGNLRRQCYEKKQQIYKQLDEEFDLLRKELERKYEKDVAALNETMNLTLFS